VLLRLSKGSAEQQAIEAGEIDAVVDHAGSNVILLPAARRALGARASIANGLLAQLPHAEHQRLLAEVEPVRLRFGEVLHEPGVPIRHVYFPASCVVSVLAEVKGGQALEVGLVGGEGAVGVSVALGIELSSVRVVVHAAGTALRIEAARFQEALLQCPALERGLYRYACAKLAMARQTAACNCFHTIGARLARYLLMASDRLRSDRFLLTQSYLAGMLGVRRATVNEAAGPLQERGLIGWGRGRVAILDRKGLEATACACYTRIWSFVR
jgi:CRP-like cAMP-binding protein